MSAMEVSMACLWAALLASCTSMQAAKTSRGSSVEQTLEFACDAPEGMYRNFNVWIDFDEIEVVADLAMTVGFR